MTKKQNPSHGQGPSRHKGDDQHGWATDVDATEQQDNPSGHRSFHPDTYAPGGRNRQPSPEDIEASKEGTPAHDVSRSGEERAGKSGKRQIQDTGPRGPSGRPSGAKDTSQFSGVDPQEPQTKHRGR
ncbi:hypothetical protein [Actinacidiphila glaucinigra]|uniref:Uncharacterized protein n=1 Tax=Actinacidiphila glaucinigra TaxID=235986 RepID=A0A239NMQ0_9ACTN|nr:hypothetical protein [Actinacidiphila glaucinigra]SNT55648.1 hypothetical protein SAMN05216252_1407 [Actinacidiphila glaucinigra]